MSGTPAEHPPSFCGQCGAALPHEARFCVECGAQAGVPASASPEPAVGVTIRLPNARGEQSVIGGTVRLPSSGAIPPGLWLLPEAPNAEQVVALYAPLRAVVGGWSGTTSDGWRKIGQAWTSRDSSRELVSFECKREWFPAPGCGGNLRLVTRISASSFADEGRTRRGFRYRIGTDPPMEVLDAWWIDAATRRRRDLPPPQIQLMAPPRVPRVSDFNEPIRKMNAQEAELWARAGRVHGLYRMPDPAQQRTPVGRAVPLFETAGGALFGRLAGMIYQLHRVQIHRPLICGHGEWDTLQRRVEADARELGLDMATDAMTEWWLDRQGYDGAVFNRGAPGFGSGRVVFAFRRAQIAAVEG